MKVRLPVLLALLFFFFGGLLRAGPLDGVIARARAFSGSESALNAIRTIHFSGTLETDAKNPLPVDIVFQKDFRQRITVTSPKVIETTALDGYDAWQKRTNPANPTHWELTLLDAAQIKRLRANTWENLSYYAGLERQGGTVKYEGDAMADGVACAKVSFIHDPGIFFVRYFDKATGRLIKTETENGGEIREEGEMIVDGVRFPKKVINKSANGQATTIVFDKVILNEKVPASDFAVPALQTN
jgi:hypothetical protein